jgi:hypothetical protein
MAAVGGRGACGYHGPATREEPEHRRIGLPPERFNDGHAGGESMDFLILGDGAEELAWARAIAAHRDHRLRAAFPGFDAFPDVLQPRDLDDALAVPGVDSALVGGGPAFRAEAGSRPSACIRRASTPSRITWWP